MLPVLAQLTLVLHNERVLRASALTRSTTTTHTQPLENKTFSVVLATKDLTIRIERGIERLVLVQ